ncbi:MAG: hypothetical protein ACLQGP_33965 [Isosphaeraceae bacterium]
MEQSSDGVVAYTSSHIDWSESECVVPGDHGCQDSQDTIHEIRRILAIHLEQVDRENPRQSSGRERRPPPAPADTED